MTAAAARAAPAASQTPSASILLEGQGLSRNFPGVRALADMDFDLRSGEVHILFGENGAGKSTLINILSGALRPSSGQVLLEGKPLALHSVHDARKAGIAAVFQEFSLAPDLTVEQNLYLGAELTGFGLLNKRAMRRKARQALAELGFKLSAGSLVGSLSRAEQQMVEIAKAMLTEPRVLILDEPTASLTEAEVRQLFRLVRRIKAEGVGIIYITHRMGEIQEIGDRVTVMRNGEHIATLEARAADKTQLVELMTGRSFGNFYPRIAFAPGETLLSIEGLSTQDRRVGHVSLEVHAGEIVGLAGLVGCGKSEIGRACFGLERLAGGEIVFLGERIEHPSPKKLLQRGLTYVPSDRIREGLLLERSTRENLSLSALPTPQLSRWGWLHRHREARFARELGQRMGVTPLSLERHVAAYSGGNKQKVLLGRSLASDQRLIILDEPTIGIDVGAKAEIYRLLGELVESGVGILLISSDLPEVLSLSHRVYVVHAGHIADCLTDTRITEEAALAGFFGKE